MIPLRDSVPTRSFPLITILIIGLNSVIFLFELLLDTQGQLDGLVRTMGVVPYTITHSFGLIPFVSLFTAMFLHASPVHIIGNMLYLWIFGNNVEDRMGWLGFSMFYLLSGLGATAAQIAVAPSSHVPNIGASGAIAGVLGAYLVLFPRAQVHTLVFLGYFIRVVRLPAVLVLGFWIIIQFFSGIASLATTSAGGAFGGVAWFAHIGGFIIGLVLVNVFRRKERYRL